MLSLIIVSTLITAFTIGCIFFCGALWHAGKDERFSPLEGDGIFLFVITIVFIVLTIMCWTKTGEARVKTRTLPTIERKVTLMEQEGEIKADTLYIFKFR